MAALPSSTTRRRTKRRSGWTPRWLTRTRELPCCVAKLKGWSLHLCGCYACCALACYEGTDQECHDVLAEPSFCWGGSGSPGKYEQKPYAPPLSYEQRPYAPAPPSQYHGHTNLSSPSMSSTAVSSTPSTPAGVPAATQPRVLSVSPRPRSPGKGTTVQSASIAAKSPEVAATGRGPPSVLGARTTREIGSGAVVQSESTSGIKTEAAANCTAVPAGAQSVRDEYDRGRPPDTIGSHARNTTLNVQPADTTAAAALASIAKGHDSKGLAHASTPGQGDAPVYSIENAAIASAGHGSDPAAASTTQAQHACKIPARGSANIAEQAAGADVSPAGMCRQKGERRSHERLGQGSRLDLRSFSRDALTAESRVQAI